VGDTGKSATPGQAARASAFADPIHLNVFRVGDLLVKATDPAQESVTTESMKRYLHFPD
jgi:hypothetical protein